MQGFVQLMAMTFVSGVLARWQADSGLKIAFGVQSFLTLGYLVWRSK